MGFLCYHLNPQPLQLLSLAGRDEKLPPNGHVHMLFPRHCPSPPTHSLDGAAKTALRKHMPVPRIHYTKMLPALPGMHTYRGPELNKKTAMYILVKLQLVMGAQWGRLIQNQGAFFQGVMEGPADPSPFEAQCPRAQRA